MDTWDRFYTPSWVARSIVSRAARLVEPVLAGDLCAGTGAFVLAINQLWPTARIIAADIRTAPLERISRVGIHNLRTVSADAADLSQKSPLLANLRTTLGRWDIALANPPFGRRPPRSNGQCASLIRRDPVLFQLWQHGEASGRLEACILIANIVMLRPNGILGGVFPENIFSSEKYSAFRRVLFGSCLRILWLTESERIFKDSDVRTRRMVAIRQGPDRWSDGSQRGGRRTMGIQSVHVKRGVYAAKRRLHTVWGAPALVPAIHSDHFRRGEVLIKPPARRYIGRQVVRRRGLPWVSRGDLAIVRVGKTAGRSAIVPAGYNGWTISDCVFLIRGWSSIGIRALRILTRELSKKARARGLVVHYLTVADVRKAIQKVEGLI